MLVIISGIVVFTSTSNTKLVSFTRAADSQCGNKYTDSTRCTNPPAAVNCHVECDANGENPKAKCDECPKPDNTGGTDTCNEYKDATNCQDGKEKTCKVLCDKGSCPGGGKSGTHCTVICGDCAPKANAGPTTAPGGGDNPPGGDYVPDPAPTDLPPGKNCKVTGSGSCGSAEFYGYTPGPGKMACCSGTGVGQYGSASDCDPAKCNNGKSICEQHPEGGTFKEGACGNPVTCPRTTQPSAVPTQVCEEKVKGQYCEKKNCHFYNTIYNTCTGQDVRYEDTGSSCCNNETPPPTPTQKPKTPNQVTKCDGLEVIYKDPSGNQQTILSNDYQRVIEVYPGSNVTYNRLHLSNGSYEKGFGWAFDISCLLTNPASCTVDSLIAQAKTQGFPKALPQTIPASQDPNATGQFNGVRTITETNSEGGTCAVRIKAKPVTPGYCASLSVSLEKGGSVNVNSATADNKLPRIPDPGEKMTLNSTAGPGSEFTIYWIRPANSPQEYVPAQNAYTKASGCSFYILNPDGQPAGAQGTYTMPDWKSAPLHRNDSYGKTNCADIAINFDAGVIFGANYLPSGIAFGDANWCRNAGPNTTDAILHHGIQNLGQKCDTICVAVASPQTPTKTPQQSTCSQTCDDTTNPCATGLQCITATNGQKYCSQPNLVEACKAAPSATSCCTEPTPTRPPSPTPPPNECGYTPCDNATAPCKQGLTCVTADNGQKYCAKLALTEQCGTNPSTTNCCTETTPTPIPTKKPAALKCGETCDETTGKICGNGMTCVQSDNGSYCAMDKYQDACREMGTYDACCKAPVTVQCGESCGTNNRVCQPGYTCTDYGSGKVCSKNSLMPQCTEASTSNAKTDCCTEVTPTPPPTYTPYPSPTPYPTFTPLPPPPQQQIQYIQQVQPTYTPIPPPPTYTVIPTFTPFPTQPPQATYTPVPPPPRSGNPIPFVVAGVPIILLILGMLL